MYKKQVEPTIKRVSEDNFRIFVGRYPVTPLAANPRQAARELRNIADRIETSICAHVDYKLG